MATGLGWRDGRTGHGGGALSFYLFWWWFASVGDGEGGGQGWQDRDCFITLCDAIYDADTPQKETECLPCLFLCSSFFCLEFVSSAQE
jgi:hypothetical protein